MRLLAVKRGRRIAALTLAVAGVAGCHSLPGKTVRAKAPLIQAPSPCVDFTVPIYFEARSAVITHQARDLLKASARRAAGCAVTGIDVVGLADAAGSPGANLELSKRRADDVTLALGRLGFNKVAFTVSAAGAFGAETTAGQASPLRRRAEVVFHLTAPTGR